MHTAVEELLEVMFSASSMPAAITSRLWSLESETVKYSHDSRRTWTQEWLHWWGPAAIVNERPILSSDSLTVIQIWSWAPDYGLTPRQTGQLIISHNMTLTLTLLNSHETAVRILRGWCEMAVILRGREPGSRGTSTFGRHYQAVQWRLTENTSLCVIVICKV
jgi:hypothetical protein